MRITVHQTQVTTAGIADLRPVGLLAPVPVRSSVTRRAHAALARSGSTGPALRRRPVIAPGRPRPSAEAASGDTVVVTVVRPPRYIAGGGPRARPATTH